MKTVTTKSQIEKEIKELESFGKRVFPCSPPLNVEFDLSVLKGKKNVGSKKFVWIL